MGINVAVPSFIILLIMLIKWFLPKCTIGWHQQWPLGSAHCPKISLVCHDDVAFLLCCSISFINLLSRVETRKINRIITSPQKIMHETRTKLLRISYKSTCNNPQVLYITIRNSYEFRVNKFVFFHIYNNLRNQSLH